MYSRHPDPRRMWKGGSEQHLLTPLPGVPGVPGVPRANCKKLDVDVFYLLFEKCLFLFSVKCYMLLCFTMISQRDPKGRPEEAKGMPKGDKGISKGFQSVEGGV